MRSSDFEQLRSRPNRVGSKYLLLAQSGNRAAAASSAPPTFDDKTAFGFLSDQLARERLRDFKLRSPEDYADSMTSRALFTKEWSAMLGL